MLYFKIEAREQFQRFRGLVFVKHVGGGLGGR